MNELTFRLRIDYGKIGRLRYLSHLELARAIERVIRRSQLPFALSKGFNVHMKQAFGPALPVGTAGLHELLDIWLTAYVPAPEAYARLRLSTIPDLPINEVSYCATYAPSLQSSFVLSHYEAIIAISHMEEPARLEQVCSMLLESGSLTISKKGKPKTIDLTSSLAEGPTLSMINDTMLKATLTLRASAEGSVRPEALLNAAFGRLEGFRIIALTRTALHEEP